MHYMHLARVAPLHAHRYCKVRNELLMPLIFVATMVFIALTRGLYWLMGWTWPGYEMAIPFIMAAYGIL